MEEIAINKLIKWNSYLQAVSEALGVIPFSNQLIFLRSDEKEVLYGGAARGGKSVAMLMAALQYIDIPNYHALIIRKTYTELSKADGLIPLSKQWLMNTDARWNEKNSEWTFPNGSTLTFGYLANENDIYNYIGLAFQFIGFDELTQHTEQNYRFLFSRLVRNTTQAAAGIPIRMRATTNPNGVGAQWVYDRFINKANKPAIYEEAIRKASAVYRIPEEGVTKDVAKEFMPRFIPSKMIDNPYIDQTSYMASLQELDPVTRKQLLDGDWEIRPAGNMFRRDWFELIKPRFLDARDFTKMVRYWDFAATTSEESDFTATCKMGYNKKDKCIYIFDVQKFKMHSGEVEEKFKELQGNDGMRTITIIEQEPGSAGVNNTSHYRRDVSRLGYQLKADKVSGNKIIRAQPLSGASGNGLVKIVEYPRVRLWFDDCMSQLEAFPDGEHDDMVDAMSGAFNYLMTLIRGNAAFVGQLKDDSGPNPNDDSSIVPAYMATKVGDKPRAIDLLVGNKPQLAFGDWRTKRKR